MCSHYLSSRVGQVLSCRPQVSGGHLQAEKTLIQKEKTSTGDGGGFGVCVTYFPKQSPAKYRQRTCA